MVNMKDDDRTPTAVSEELQRLRRRVAELERYKSEHEKVDEALRESEEKYRSLVENVNFGIYRNTGGPHGRFLQANPAIARMFGYDSVAEFMKVPVSSLYQNPEERIHFIDEALRNGFLRDKAIRLKKQDGTPIVGSCTSQVQYDKDGSIKWIDGVIEDITERKLADEIIEKSRYYEHTISSVLKVALEPVSLDEQLNIILDLILEIPFISPLAKGLIYLIEEDPGVLVMKAQHGFDAEELSDYLRVPLGCELCGKAASSCEITFSGDVTVNKEKGPGKLPHGQYCVPISSGDHVYGVMSLVLKEGHTRDEQEEKFLISIADTLTGIIEHRRTEIEKEKLRSRLIQSEKLSALGRITANVAHEIRNPLTVLGGLAKRLGRSDT
jgi:PAS domain S-box-containing protein